MNITLDDEILKMLNKIAEKHDNQDVESIIHGAIQYFILLHFIRTEDQLLIREILNKYDTFIELKGLQ